MKRKLSIPALWVRMSFWGAVGIVLAAFCVQLLLLRLSLSGAASGAAFSDVVEGAFAKYVFRAAFALMYFWILISSRGSDLTLGRLYVSGVSLVLWQGAVILGWFVLLLAAQIGAVLVGFRWFLGVMGPAAGRQTLLIAFYQSPTLHSLMPLSDRLLLADDLSLLLSLAFATAVDVHLMRRDGRKLILSGLLAAEMEILVGLSLFGSSLEGSWVFLASAILLAAVQAVRLARSVREEAAR